MGYQYIAVFQDGINITTNWFKPLRLGQFYGVASFAIEGVGLILPIRGTMQDYKSFRWMFHLIGGLIVVWYFFFGMSGAMVDASDQRFGENVPGIILFGYSKVFKFVYTITFFYSIVVKN